VLIAAAAAAGVAALAAVAFIVKSLELELGRARFAVREPG
jgi:hypothetical protein